jgi:hypothetical protein
VFVWSLSTREPPYQQTFLAPDFYYTPRPSVSLLFRSGLEPALFKRPQLHFIAPGWRPHPQQPSRTSLQQPPPALPASQPVAQRLRSVVRAPVPVSSCPHSLISLSHSSPPVPRPCSSPSTHCRCDCGRRGPGVSAVPGLGARSAMAGRLMLALPILLFLLLVGELQVALSFLNVTTLQLRTR